MNTDFQDLYSLYNYSHLCIPARLALPDSWRACMAGGSVKIRVLFNLREVKP